MDVDEFLSLVTTDPGIAQDFHTILMDNFPLADEGTRAKIIREFRERIMAEWIPYCVEDPISVSPNDLYQAVAYLLHLSRLEMWSPESSAYELLLRLTRQAGEVLPEETFSFPGHDHKTMKVECACIRWAAGTLPDGSDECPWCNGTMLMDLPCTRCGGYGSEPVS